VVAACLDEDGFPLSGMGLVAVMGGGNDKDLRLPSPGKNRGSNEDYGAVENC
jgi:hypothetical protein